MATSKSDKKEDFLEELKMPVASPAFKKTNKQREDVSASTSSVTRLAKTPKTADFIGALHDHGEAQLTPRMGNIHYHSQNFQKQKIVSFPQQKGITLFLLLPELN